MKDITATLMNKGWNKSIIQKTADILAHAEAAKNPSMLFLEQLAFWVALGIAIIGNFVISVVIVPFLLLLQGTGLYFTVFIIGAAFGLLFNVLINYIEGLKQGQHIIAGAFIPALALINIYLITSLSNKLELLLQLTTPPHSPLGVSVVYVVGFVLPYVVQHFKHLKKKHL